MIQQQFDPNQNGLGSVNIVSEKFAYGSFISSYRRHQNSSVSPAFEEAESDTSDH